jgi:membrane-bound lytic murein transglycosylase B
MQFFKRGLIVFLIIASLVGSVPIVTRAAADPCSSDIVGQSKAQLQIGLDACLAEIAQWTTMYNNANAESASYKRDISLLTAKINAAQAGIKAKNIAIANLSHGIAEKQATITTLNSKLEAGKNSLSEIIRKTDAIDSSSLAVAMLSDKDLSDFFVDVNTYMSTEKSLESLFGQIRGSRTAAEAAKSELDKEKQAAANAKAQIEAAKKQVESDQRQKNQLLADSTQKAKTYSNELADRQAKASQIRAALFSLADTAAIPFGTALLYANQVSQVTGVPASFLLAILTQESNLGANVGACYVANPATGDGVGVTSGAPKSRVMSPTRDVPVFLDILAKVGGDISKTRVSCWQPIYSAAGNPIGWGGAMGPAQFIPSTWKLFTGRITSANGAVNPNPWNARDAFFAAGLYLKDLGAGSGVYADEKNAACKYFSGSKCSSSSYGNTYGSQVMTKAANIQTTMIDPLQGL